MTYATNEERKALIETSIGLNMCPFVVRFQKGSRSSELVADDIEHALTLQKQWIDAGASYVEIFRVFEYDGSLNPTIGPYRGTDDAT